MKRKLLAGILVILIASAAIFCWCKKEQPNQQTVTPIKIYIHGEKKVQTMEMEEYIVGVVLAEMPASFSEEALKAQAVCARTYAFKRYYAGAVHPRGAAVCDNPNHCQAFVDPISHIGRTKMVMRIRKAVQATRGQVILYQGNLIDPVYHSTCGGHTVSSWEVWGTDYPYLRGVPCRWDSESPYHLKSSVIAREIFQKRLKLKADQSSAPSLLKTSEHGVVSKIAWTGQEMSGQQFRELFGLPSSRFALTSRGGKVFIKTVGYGHGVGLCQYGANGMAGEGRDYLDILHYYYKGVTIWQIEY